ncbi:MAG: DMT family transporter [Acinetobacter sp.]
MNYSLYCAVFWATTGIFVKSIDGIAISVILLLRCLIAALFLFITYRLLKRKQLEQSPLPRFLTYGMVAVMLFYYITATYAFIFAPVALATLLMSLSPCMAILYRITTKEKIYHYEIIGFMLAFLGVFLYVYPSFHASRTALFQLLFGCFLAFSAAVFKAVNSIMIWKNKEILTTQHFDKIHLQTFLLGIVVMFILSLGDFNAMVISEQNVVLLLGLGILSTAIPSVLNSVASIKITPVIHNIIGMSTPVFASLFAYAFLGESLTTWSIFSLLLSLLGVLMIIVFSALFAKR